MGYKCYDYRCPKCGKVRELIVSDENETKCKCGGWMHRLMCAPGLICPTPDGMFTGEKGLGRKMTREKK